MTKHLVSHADRDDQTQVTAEDKFIVLALKKAALARGADGKFQPLSKALVRRLGRQGGLTPAQFRYYTEHSELIGMLLQDRIMAMAFEAKDPRVLKLGFDAAMDYKDRVRGKATEKVQVAQAVRVEVGGIDLGSLPGQGAVVVDATVVTDGTQPPEGSGTTEEGTGE